jgi:hypothetical protein
MSITLNWVQLSQKQRYSAVAKGDHDQSRLSLRLRTLPRRLLLVYHYSIHLLVRIHYGSGKTGACSIRKKRTPWHDHKRS